MKPFNLEQAAAGAPVGLDDGTKGVRIICTDRKGGASVMALVAHGGGEAFLQFHSNGVPAPWSQPTLYSGLSLVMAPIGEVAGQAVYVGDELTDAAGNIFIADHREPWYSDAEGFMWPNPYSVTKMDARELLQAWCGKEVRTSALDGAHLELALRIANAAIRHGIDNGYLEAKK